MIVSYHDYNLKNESFVDGANCYYIENTNLLKEYKSQDLMQTPHDFKRIVLGEEKLPYMGKDDVLLSNVGPYAHVYHYLREKQGLKFRIIRDVQTTLWPGYLFQEKICGKYTREDDKVMFLSEFTRQLYLKLFPESLNEENTFVCAPFMHFFPKNVKREEKKDDTLNLGWVGRVTPEKNFHQTLQAFITINKQNPKTKFIVAGRSSNKVKRKIRKELKKYKIKPEDFNYVNDGHFVPQKNIWDVYKEIDVFLFPSASINESLGRVMVEACYMGIPVVAANHGAAPELLSKRNLVQVKYKDKLFQLDSASPYSFGEVVMEDFINKIQGYKSLSVKSEIRRYTDHYEKFFRILKGVEPEEKPIMLNKSVQDFIGRVKIHKDYTCLSMERIMDMTKRFVSKETDNRRLFIKKCPETRTVYETRLGYSKENYYVLNKYNFFLSAFLGYNPYMSLDETSLKVRLQEVMIHLKRPFSKPFKIALYFYLKDIYVKNLNSFSSS